MEDRRALVADALAGRPVSRIPAGFWFHFADESLQGRGLEDPRVVEASIAGHQAYFDSARPDFLKLMSDGFFRYPRPELENFRPGSVPGNPAPLGPGHPWLQAQADLAGELGRRFGREVYTFYNIFSPATLLRFLWEPGVAAARLGELAVREPRALSEVLDLIATDLVWLVRQAVHPGGTDGIYLSVQDFQDPRIPAEVYRKVVAPSEIRVLRAAKEAGGVNILHICGYEGGRNRLELFSDYPAEAVNWAVHVEGVGLGAGKSLFPGKAVIGGFANGPGSLLHRGSKEAVQAFARGLAAGTDGRGIIAGADCTVPPDIDMERFAWVREALGAH